MGGGGGGMLRVIRFALPLLELRLDIAEGRQSAMA